MRRQALSRVRLNWWLVRWLCRKRIRCLVAGWALFAIAFGLEYEACAESDQKSFEFFESEIRPLLIAKCQRCHGPKKQEAGLRLDSRAAMLKGGESGPAIVPGKPDLSLLIEAVRYESLEMPPDAPLDASSIGKLTEWIQRGAAWPDLAQHPLRKSTGAVFSESERKYWSLQQITRPSIPQPNESPWCRNPIDSFILQELEVRSLTPAPTADRVTLIRRATMDALGLPPTWAEIQSFVQDPAQDDAAFRQLIERLLSSAHFGERAAQHWLDLVRFSESDGYNSDHFRPQAWRYRDYVVDAFNHDKPYDRFVKEQLAGDELAPDDPSVRVATGFLRLGVYEYNQRDARFHWSLIMDEMTNVVGETFLGLSFRCARCHDHKFDPVLQSDYYRLQAFFAPMLWDDSVPHADQKHRQRFDQKMTKWREETKQAQTQLALIEDPIMASLAKQVVVQFPDDIREMFAKPHSQQTSLEQQLCYLVDRQIEFKQLELPKKIKGETKKRWDALKKQLIERPKPLPKMFTVRDAQGVLASTMIPGTEVEVAPGFLTILDPKPVEPTAANGDTTGRRTALAKWLTHPTNPLTARVIVNRIWQSYFGVGLVATSSEFGKMGTPPSHPQLLDWLANYLQQSPNPWQLKKIHRMILTSATYRQSAFHPRAQQQQGVDPKNQFRWGTEIRRLDAEQIRDALLVASGELDAKVGGISVEDDRPRRSIYVRRIRNKPSEMLKAFDAPSGYVSTSNRDRTTTPLQILLLLNSPESVARARAIADRILKEGASTELAQVTKAYQLIFGREPDDRMQQQAVGFLKKQRESLLTVVSAKEPVKSKESKVAKNVNDGDQSQTVKEPVKQRNPSLESLTDFCHVLINANAFLYLD